MKKILSALPLVLTSVLSLAIFGVSAMGFLEEEKFLTEVGGVGAEPLKEYLSLKAESPSSQSVSSQQGGAVETVGGSADAIGKVFEQFLSPYKAAVSYNGIYLKNTSGLSVDLKSELSAGWSKTLSKDRSPQVLIVHTHATECYSETDKDYYTSTDKTRTTDNDKNVTHVGEIMANILKEGGIGVIHDRTHHDHPAYNGSYSRAATTINEYLKKYPSIKIVVDVHRDSISMNTSDKCKPTVTIEGKKVAQVMLVMGSQSGTVSGFPNWKENFRLGIRYQQTMEALYPGLARPMVLTSHRYNENLTTGSMILEVGTDVNTFEEACYSAELAGKSLLSLLNTLKE